LSAEYCTLERSLDSRLRGNDALSVTPRFSRHPKPPPYPLPPPSPLATSVTLRPTSVTLAPASPPYPPPHPSPPRKRGSSVVGRILHPCAAAGPLQIARNTPTSQSPLKLILRGGTRHDKAHQFACGFSSRMWLLKSRVASEIACGFSSRVWLPGNTVLKQDTGRTEARPAPRNSKLMHSAASLWMGCRMSRDQPLLSCRG
jgi:hypothetical protein